MKYIARAEAGVGWQIWNRATKRRWGNVFPAFPEKVLAELNGEARPGMLVKLSRETKPRVKS